MMRHITTWRSRDRTEWITPLPTLDTAGTGELPSLAKEGWLRPLRKSREASLAGADGVVRSSHRLSEVERTTPAAPFNGRDHLLDGAATPPLPRRGVPGNLRREFPLGISRFISFVPGSCTRPRETPRFR